MVLTETGYLHRYRDGSIYEDNYWDWDYDRQGNKNIVLCISIYGPVFYAEISELTAQTMILTGRYPMFESRECTLYLTREQ